MEEERKPKVDHTGEVYNNRRITGPGTWHQPLHGHGHWSWKWVCLECGAVGECSTMQQIKGWGHWCPGTPRKAPEKFTYIEKHTPKVRKTDWSKVCSRQCRNCGHYAGYEKACLYYLDTGQRRPKVDLRKEPCPVRDPSFKRPSLTWPEPLTPKDGKENVT